MGPVSAQMLDLHTRLQGRDIGEDYVVSVLAATAIAVVFIAAATSIVVAGSFVLALGAACLLIGLQLGRLHSRGRHRR